MRLVLVNHAHPALPHVSALRASRFAEALAARGHQVLLLTATRPGRPEDACAPEALAERIASWPAAPGAAPGGGVLHCAVAPQHRPWLAAARAGRLPVPLRRAVTLWQWLRHLGQDEDWVAACAPHLALIASRWRPDAVWGTFGAMSNLKLAQALGRASGAPWVADFKDPWDEFVHPWLRGHLATRLGDAAAATANSEFNAARAARWFAGLGCTTVYSGVDAAFLSPAPEAGPATTEPAEFVLVGGIYKTGTLTSFLGGFARWVATLPAPERAALRLVYLGGDGARAAEALAATPPGCATEVGGYLPHAALASRCRAAFAVGYVADDRTFHHKTLELLASGRPVICHPRDLPEAEALAAAAPGQFHPVAEAAALPDALGAAWRRRREPPRPVAAAAGWGWDARAVALEAVLQRVALRREGGR